MKRNAFFRKLNLLIALGGVLAGLILWGCDNLLASASSPDTPPASLAQTQMPASAKEGYGIVNGVLPSTTKSTARTAMPSAAVTVVSYKVFAQNGSERIEANVNDASATFSIALPYGTWNVTARGLDAGGKIVATQTQAVTLSEAVSSVSINFALGYSTNSSDGAGKTSLSVSFPSDKIHGVEYTLSKGATQILVNADATELGAGSFKIERTFEELGAWHLTIKFYGDFSNLVYRIDQTVNVYANLTTDAFVGSAPYISDGKIDLTEDLLAEFQSTTLYVNATSGKDTNSGTQFDPLKTFNRAVELVNISTHEPGTEFRIFLQTDVLDGAELELGEMGNGKKLTVASADGSPRKVRSLGRTLKVKGASELALQSVNFENLRFEIDGNCTFTMNGGGISGNNITALGGAIYCSGTANITGATFSGNTAGDNGGAICITSGSTVMLEDCAFSDNTAKDGGAICINGGTLTVKGDTTISENAAQNGGGIYLSVGTLTIDGDTKITKNEATGSDGGGVCLKGGTFTMNGGTISGNTAKFGGGVQLGGGTFTMAGGTITENHALGKVNDSGELDGGGGGVHIYKGTFEMTGGTISKNDCEGNSDNSGGGGIFIYNGNTATISGGTISENFSSVKGGGIYLMPNGTLKVSGTAKISKNTSSTNGGGVYIREDSTFTMSGGAVSDNTAQNGGGGGVYIYKGTFTMEGGAVSGNATTNYHGGGVCVTEGGKFTMKGGTIGGSAESEKNTAKVKGGAVYVNSGSTFTMEGGTITGNTAEQDGGAVYVTEGSTFTMDGTTSTISNNKASLFGGGVYVEGDYTTNKFGTFTMKGGSITGNEATNATSGSGGGVCVYNGAFTMEGGTISKNTAAGTSGENFGGGGVFLYRATASTLGGTFTMKGGTVSENEAKFGGGIWTSIFSEFEMSGGTFSGNTVTNNGKGKGAYVNPGNTFAMSGAARFDEDNDVYLYASGSNIATITVAGALTATSPVATITPSSYPTNGDTRQVLSKGTGITAIASDICKLFALTTLPDDDTEWKISPDGTGTKGILKVNSDTIYVRGTGATAFPSNAALGSDSNSGSLMSPFATIQKAVDTVIADNDGSSPYTIYVDGTLDGTTAGAYLGASGMADFTALDKELTLTIKALSESAKATLDGGARFDSNGNVTNAGIGKGVIFAKSKPDTDGKINLTLENLVIKGGNKAGNGAGVYLNSPGGTLTIGDGTTISGNRGGFGGGVSINSGAFTMTGGTVSGNWSTENSGGVDIGSGGASFTMTGGTISDNTAQNGGGVLVANGGTVTMSGGTITGNTAQYGGGVYNRGTFAMSGSAKISGNNASQDGGGVYDIKQDEGNAEFTMEDGTVSGNTANYGGGVYVKDGGTFTMKKGTISGNTARGKVNDSGKLDGGGGGVYLFGSEFTMSGGTITGNKVTNGNAEGSGGGGVYAFGGINAGSTSTFTMTGGTVSGNTAANGQGKGAFISPGCTFNMSGAAQFADTDDVYLYVYTGATLPTITVAGNLSKTKVATITPSNYIGGTPVLTKGGSAAITQAICGKFALSEEVWKIVPDSTGTNGVLMTTTVYVASTGSDTTGNGTEARPFATIQKAVDTVLAMNDGTSAYTIYIDGTLQCDDSTYVGAKGMADFSALTKNLTLTIKALSGTATLDGGARLTASGSVTNAGIKKSIIYAKPTSGTLNLTLENLVIMGGNYSGGSGGGIYFKGKTLEMTGCTISGCTSSYGGGVCVDAGTFTMTGCTISGCTASRGGGVYNSGTFTIDGCTISDCTATFYGGGVCNSGMFTMNSGTITGNTASNDGGGVQNSGTFTMNNGEISRNTAAGSDSTGNGGGGVYVSSGTFTMRGGTITGNTASNNGGGVHVYDLATFTNTGGTITGNTAGTNGGGVYVFGSRATFTNTGGTISGNTPDDVYPAS